MTMKLSEYKYSLIVITGVFLLAAGNELYSRYSILYLYGSLATLSLYASRSMFFSDQNLIFSVGTITRSVIPISCLVHGFYLYKNHNDSLQLPTITLLLSFLCSAMFLSHLVRERTKNENSRICRTIERWDVVAYREMPTDYNNSKEILATDVDYSTAVKVLSKAASDGLYHPEALAVKEYDGVRPELTLDVNVRCFSSGSFGWKHIRKESE